MSLKVGLDTSVVLRLLVGDPAEQAEAALKYLTQLQQKGGRALISDLVIAETYFALQFHYKVPKAEALKGLRQLLGSKGIENSGVAGRVLETLSLESARPGFVDRIIHQQYLQTADGMTTFEKATSKLQKTTILT